MEKLLVTCGSAVELPVTAAHAMAGASLLVTLAHCALVLAVVGVWQLAFARSFSRRGRIVGLVLTLVWLEGTWMLARSEVLLDPLANPPRVVFLFAPTALATIALMLSPVGARLLERVPLAWIIGFQLFRLPVELILWRLAHEGLITPRMTFEGANYDVLTAVLAPVIAFQWSRSARASATVFLWNVGGLALLVNVVSHAVRSFPGVWRVHTDEPATTIVLSSVFVWIPAVYVVTALASHVLVFRALFSGRARVQP